MTDEQTLIICLYIAAFVAAYIITEVLLYLDTNYFIPRMLYRRSGVKRLIERIEKELNN